MKFQTIMHVSFLTNQFDEMLDFYTKKLGLELKVLVRYKSYLNRDDRPIQQAVAREDPERIFNAYVEIAPGQYIELFPADEKVKPHPEFNENLGYSHFALIVEDIEAAYQQILEAGIKPDTGVSKGPSGTWQFWLHDPDGNRFEMMQYTPQSYQVTGYIDE